MADWDENENAYNADPEKYLANLEVELTQQREAQNLREATTLSNPKWTRPRIGVRRDYSERYQRGADSFFGNIFDTFVYVLCSFCRGVVSF